MNRFLKWTRGCLVSPHSSQMSQDIVHATNSEVAHVRTRSLHRGRSRLGSPQPDGTRPSSWHLARWIYKLLERYREGGYAALEPRSRRPHSSATKTCPEV